MIYVSSKETTCLLEAFCLLPLTHPVSTSTYIVTFAPQFPERLNIKPGSLIPCSVQRHPHSILLQQSWQPLIDCEVLVTLYVQ